ncbi:hypothetical protein L596_023652 [Steinernema carpocapsae]|uniref:Aladin seven-bladed propeller domain-containing protein n=1 Tax=Steinernema carpocapsae TaxID=34508 RepID=A0A4U5MEC1_STECR|nr:hypothetical protein L596_023652 [Steinernema carpocapsae]
MSLLNFPPLKEDLDQCYAVQDVHGKLSQGSRDDVHEFMLLNLKEYPLLDRAKMQQMQQSISYGNLDNAFKQDSSIDKISKIARIWNRQGATGVVGYMVGGEQNKLGKLVRSVSFGLIAPMEDIEKAGEVDSLYEECCSTLNWKSNWIRCVAWHPSGTQVAICQPSDYVRVFKIAGSSSPTTLHHTRQRSVSSMAWKRFDQRVLAVGCRDCVILWRIPEELETNRVPHSCAQIIEDHNLSPVIDLFWDSATYTTLYACSGGSSRLTVHDVITDEQASVSCGERVGRLYPSRSGGKIMTALMNNSFKVFDKLDWTFEKWSGLAGRCTSAVWTPREDYLLFTTAKEKLIFYVRFNQHGNTSKTFGTSKANVAFDVSEVIMTDADGDISDRAVGGFVKDMAMSDDGARLAVTFQDNPRHIALFIVDTSPLLNLIPSTLIEAPAYGLATSISFVPEFNEGSLLCIVWSEGKVQYVPIVYGLNRSRFNYSSYASLNCSSILGGLTASNAVSPEPFFGDEKVNLSSDELLRLSHLEKSLSPSAPNHNTSSINLFSTSGFLDASFQMAPEEIS